MKNKLILGTVLSFMLFACGSNEEKQDIQVDNEQQEKEVHVNYNIPSPSEQFALISKMDAVKNTQILHDAALADKYVNSNQKALNFGVYTADVAYLTSFNETNKYLSYFGKLEKLGSDIGVAKVFGNELGELAKKWDGNADSLFSLSDQVYNRTFQQLIEIDKGEELSLMLVGGWIESLHLMIGSSKGFGKSPMLDQALADQKLVAENLLEFMVSYQDNQAVKEYATSIEEILTIFNDLDCNSSETKVQNSNGKLSFSGGDSCKMTKKCYDALVKKVQEVRTKIVTV
ncbi:MAG TPA: hypothetical protein PLI97_10860 [Fluviicola sp.]|nr:hypothetical protein [Fluviicola sp.]